MRDDLISPDLFGNDAGEDETPEILSSYFLEKEEFVPFFAVDTRIAFVRSRKGMGKSALLSELAYRTSKTRRGDLVIYVKASDLIAIQSINSDNAGALVYGWQQRICTRVSLELGRLVNHAFSDDSIKVVEQAEVAGFRGRNLVGSLLDRLRIKAGGVEIGRNIPSIGDSKETLKRLSANESINVWLLVDDIDATFANSAKERLSVSTFFSACRNLVQAVQGVNIRASVRSDVWAIIAQHDEALDKCEQYMLDLQWSIVESGLILENKLRSYFERKYTTTLEWSRKEVLNEIFKTPMYWGGSYVSSPVRPIHILSNGRPRWATKLCRLSAKRAYRLERDTINGGDIEKSMTEYGAARLSDLYKEHRHQCANIDKLVEAFSQGATRFSTKQLLRRIEDKIVTVHGMPKIDGNDGIADTMGVAHFMFRIGFISARDDSEQPTVFVSFEDRPNLLTSVNNPDDGLVWEVHPSYRTVLRIRRLEVAGR